MLENDGQHMKSTHAKQLEAKVWEHLENNEVQAAISACEQLNREFPNFAAGWYTTSQMAFKLGNTAMALDAIREARRMDPEPAGWAVQEARCLWKLGQLEEARACIENLSCRAMATAYECAALGLLLANMGQRREALTCYKQAAALAPTDSRHYFNCATLQRTLGEFDDAEHNFDRAIALKPEDYEAWKLRSELRTWTAENNHVEALEKVLDSGIEDPRGTASICYALAKELEDIGETDRSFFYLRRGANYRRKNMRYDLERDLSTIRAIQDAFSVEFLARGSDGDDSSKPIFVLGMPRTGTTLVERILASHTDVTAAGELVDFAEQMMAQVRQTVTVPPVSREALVQLSTGIDFAALGRAYIAKTARVAGNTPRFVDKLPLNYLYVGLIHLSLPNAKIVHVARDPMDTIYAIFKTLFTDAYPFSYTLDELARYYVEYHRLMEHWCNALPDVVYTVRYEDLVADVETHSRHLLQACGLDWQARCLDFHLYDAASTTASAVQVRQPVYQSSVQKWRNHAAQLQPAFEILNEAGIVGNEQPQRQG